MNEVTDVFSKYVSRLNRKDIPDEVIDLLRVFVADYYAASFAGYRINHEFNRAVTDTMTSQNGEEESSVFLQKRRYPMMTAAWLNAAYAHGADMDDGNKKSMGHIAAHCMSSVFALAEKTGSKMSDVYTALIAGYEVFNRIGAAAQPGISRRGFHGTGMTGPIASAAACARLLCLDEQGIYNAMSIAALQASGLFIITESGQACKAFSAANSARTGLLSAMLAAKGIKGPVDPIEGNKGWFRAMSEEWDTKKALEGLGDVFTIKGTLAGGVAR